MGLVVALFILLIPVAVVAFLIFVVVMIVKGVKEAKLRREAMEMRIQIMQEAVRRLGSDLSTVDEKTADRVRQACTACQEKLYKAREVLVRGRDRDYARAEGILAQVQAKLDNARAGIDRSQQRQTEKEQRQAEKQSERQAQREADAGASQTARKGSFGASGPMSGRTTDWNTVSQSQCGACFFCSRPAYLSELAPVMVNLDGSMQRVLACRDDRMAVQSGQIPPIRAFNIDGRHIPWYAHSAYNPYRDYYAYGYDEPSLLIDICFINEIEPFFWGWGTGSSGNWDTNYAFTPDHEYYQDYYSAQAAAYPNFDPNQPNDYVPDPNAPEGETLGPDES